MPMLHTYQSGYEKLRLTDVTLDDATLACYSVAPSTAHKMDGVFNGIEIYWQGDGTDGSTMACELWGYASNGPAELIADISGLSGTMKFGADTTIEVFVDTLVVDGYHVEGIRTKDIGNNRIAKMTFDAVGYDKIYTRYYHVGDVTEMDRVNAYVRGW